jgi:hypothetical protein
MDKLEWLKAVLGDDLFGQVIEKLNAHNGDEANKENQIKLANLGAGGYVSKDKFTALETDKGNISAELEKANGLIAELKKNNKGNADLQAKVTQYEADITALKEENTRLKGESTMKVALLNAGAKADDMDYLLFKATEGGKKPLEFTDDGAVKGQDTIIESLKTSCPNQFTTASGQQGFNGFRPMEKDEQGGGDTMTRETLQKLPYSKQVEFFNAHPEQYRELMA